MWVGVSVRAGIFENALDCGAELADAQSIFTAASGTVWMWNTGDDTASAILLQPRWACSINE